MTALTRRGFLVASGAVVALGASGGLLVAARRTEGAAFAAPDAALLNAWLRVAPDGAVTVAVPRAEMGQGVRTALAMIAAEELDADWARVRVEHAPVDAAYTNLTVMLDGIPADKALDRWFIGRFGRSLEMQMTGGSTSVRDAWDTLRLAGAAARAMLCEAAAGAWGVPAAELTTESGAVLHPASGRRAPYGELAAAAARLPPPAAPPLKAPESYRLLGRPVPRLDVPDKVTGRAVYGIDVHLPDMVYAAVRHCPVLGGTLKRFDALPVMRMPGVRAVRPVPGGVAVVADGTWRAFKAAEALAVEWQAPEALVSTPDIERDFAAALASGDATEYRADDGAAEALAAGGRRVAADYAVPFLAHACMEPMTCTARIADGACTVWTGSQTADFAQRVAAEAAGLPRERVTVHTTLLGGGFGRRLETDMVAQAVTLAKAMAPQPVKLTWTREEDLRADAYRPMAFGRLEAALGADGRPQAVGIRIASPPVLKGFAARNGAGLPFPATVMMPMQPDLTVIEGLADTPYDLGRLRVEHAERETPVPVGFWRSVGHSYTAFFIESFIDELAAASAQDPLDYRRRLLADRPRHLALLDRLAAASGWGGALPPGRGRGVALHESFRTIVGQVVEVTLAEGRVRVDRVVCAVDCGRALHPDTVAGQMEGAIVFALSAALFGAVTHRDGEIEQANFPDYDMVRLAQAPEIAVHLVESGAPLGGVGEPGVPPLAPALAAAIVAAGGPRLRKLPLVRQGLAVA
ncbi:MAG TPA: molybdopterin cofactor-binding domain-containing protein [Alphaproteobacteria bacterium]|nr:molybdopterin cofactor-binding domain-containing protein [Alphaproteobacteria bacterium]